MHVFGSLPVVAPTTDIDDAWLAANGPAPWLLGDGKWRLVTDVSTEGQAFSLYGADVSFNLNRHTITYDSLNSSTPNSGFETQGATADVPANWDMTNASECTRVAVTTRPREGFYYMECEQWPTTTQTMVGEWVTYQGGVEHLAYWLRTSSQTLAVFHMMRLEIESEDRGVVEHVVDDWLFNTMQFRPQDTSRYRIRFSIPEETPDTWSASTAAKIGGFVRPTDTVTNIHLWRAAGIYDLVQTYTVDVGNNEIDAVGHGLSNGDKVRFWSDQQDPAGGMGDRTTYQGQGSNTAADAGYTVANATADTFQLRNNANTADITLTSDLGTGTSYFGRVRIEGVTGSSEPTWGTTIGGLTVDGEISWRCIGKGWDNELLITQWAADTSHNLLVRRRPTVANGYVYEVWNIDHSATTGSTEPPTWETGSVFTNETNYTSESVFWRKYDKSTPIEFDIVNAVPWAVHGIVGSDPSADLTRKVRMFNGSVVQGPGRSYDSIAINFGGRRPVELDHLTVSCNGAQSTAIGVYNCAGGPNIHHNTIRSFSEFQFNRQQVVSTVEIKGSGTLTENAKFNDNYLHAGTQSIGIEMVSLTGEILRNTIESETVITNHEAVRIPVGTKNITCAYNDITLDPGQGIWIAGEDCIVEYNTLTSNSVAPNWDDGRLSLDCIRMNDYNNESNNCKNNTIRHNTITLNGNQAPIFTPAEQVMNGILNNSNNVGNVFEYNTVVANRIDNDVKMSCVMPGNAGAPWPTLDPTHFTLYRNNTFTSDLYHLRFGGYNTSTISVRFEDNEFIKGGNPDAAYQIMYQSGGAPQIKDLRLKNNVITGGGDLDEIYGAQSPGTSDYTLLSDLVITSNWEGIGTLIADCVVKDGLGTTVHTGAVDGVDIEITLREYVWASSWSVTDYTPYTIEPAP